MYWFKIWTLSKEAYLNQTLIKYVVNETFNGNIYDFSLTGKEREKKFFLKENV